MARGTQRSTSPSFADTSSSSSSTDSDARKKGSPKKSCGKGVPAPKKSTPKKSPPKKSPPKKSPPKKSPPKKSPRKAVSKPVANKLPPKKGAPKKARYRPCRTVLDEIKRLQGSSNLLIPRAPFGRLVKEITEDLTRNEIKYARTALDALHAAAEAYLVGLFEDSYLLTLHRQRVTLTNKDIALALRIRGDPRSS